MWLCKIKLKNLTEILKTLLAHLVDGINASQNGNTKQLEAQQFAVPLFCSYGSLFR